MPLHANGLTGLKNDLFEYPKYSTARRYAGREVISGISYDVVDGVIGKGEPVEILRKVYLDSRGVLRRIVNRTSSEGHVFVSAEVVRQLVANPALKESDFVFAPPTGLKQVDLP